MKHNKGIQTTEILMTHALFKRCLRASKDGNEREIKKALAGQYTSFPRFDPDDILHIDWKALPEVMKTGGTSYVAKATIRVARGQRVLAQFVKEHIRHFASVEMAADDLIRMECEGCEVLNYLEPQSLRGTSVPEEEERRKFS